ncbi:hypothetical protein PR202_gb26391 [Eleusine coracana subsp. coracana]|uniref:Uncharacterized protein n=1 Tax=Eleusine coracana subsp. coracana TaxID=191504 RepID=A0AAV5FR17_ELECO|nr:hypothetical protein PR202_gb26391 [Eleusine coracana subsp. coracana]
MTMEIEHGAHQQSSSLSALLDERILAPRAPLMGPAASPHSNPDQIQRVPFKSRRVLAVLQPSLRFPSKFGAFPSKSGLRPWMGKESGSFFLLCSGVGVWLRPWMGKESGSCSGVGVWLRPWMGKDSGSSVAHRSSAGD